MIRQIRLCDVTLCCEEADRVTELGHRLCAEHARFYQDWVAAGQPSARGIMDAEIRKANSPEPHGCSAAADPSGGTMVAQSGKMVRRRRRG